MEQEKQPKITAKLEAQTKAMDEIMAKNSIFFSGLCRVKSYYFSDKQQDAAGHMYQTRNLGVVPCNPQIPVEVAADDSESSYNDNVEEDAAGKMYQKRNLGAIERPDQKSLKSPSQHRTRMMKIHLKAQVTGQKSVIVVQFQEPNRKILEQSQKSNRYLKMIIKPAGMSSSLTSSTAKTGTAKLSAMLLLP